MPTPLECGASLGVPPWRGLAHRFQPGPALVIGNGPSRVGKGHLIRQFAERYPGRIIGCNSIWRHGWTADEDFFALVTFDVEQTELAMEMTRISHVVVPPISFSTSGISRPTRKLSDGDVRNWAGRGRLFCAEPFRRMAASPGMRDWVPASLCAALFSGDIAFQLAWLCRANPIYLLGIDSSVRIEESGQVRSTACDRSWAGYARPRQGLREENCHRIGRHAVPRGWAGAHRAWRSMTARAQEDGIQVRRLVDGGALDWIPAELPDGVIDREAEGAPPFDSR